MQVVGLVGIRHWERNPDGLLNHLVVLGLYRYRTYMKYYDYDIFYAFKCTKSTSCDDKLVELPKSRA